MLMMSLDEASIAAAKAELEECERLISAELCKLQTQLSTTATRTSNSHLQSQATILREKEQMLKAQIEHVTSDVGDILPNDSPVLHGLLSEELASDKEQLTQTLTMLRSQRTELQQQIEIEVALKSELEHLKSFLDNQLVDTENVPQVPRLQALATAKDKYSKLKQQYKTSLDQMITFVQKQFPPLTDEDVKRWQKKSSKPASRVDPSSFLSVGAILELLMNKMLETPNDPYINIDDSLWPPYVDMLLHSGIVLRHPTDAHLIRMTHYQ